MDYLKDLDLPKAGDVVGSLIDLETGAIEFFING